MKRFLTLLLALLLVTVMTAPCVRASSITYVGGSKKFIFTPGKDENPTDLFPNFRDVMPGDTLTEQILIKNKSSNKVNVKVYLRSLGAQKDTEELLSQMKLTVKNQKGSELFEAPADEKAQLSDWVYLGTVKSGGKITLDVTLEVPITMGNEFQNQSGVVQWQFKVEEIPVSSSPKTGDSTNIFFFGGVLTVSAAGLFLLLLARKRRKEEE